jgi:hypothetical protein
MIAPTSSGAKTNSGMSGWPVERPSARASARPSILYLRESVRKGGAAGCGLVPERPTAWQRAQFVTSRNSPRPAGGGGLLCQDRCQDRPRHAHGDHRDETIESLPAHMLLLVPPAPHGRMGVATKSKMGSSALIWLKSAMRLLDGSNRYRVAQDALEASASESRIPAIKAMRTRSDRLAACILIMRLAR